MQANVLEAGLSVRRAATGTRGAPNHGLPLASSFSRTDKQYTGQWIGLGDLSNATRVSC